MKKLHLALLMLVASIMGLFCGTVEATVFDMSIYYVLPRADKPTETSNTEFYLTFSGLNTVASGIYQLPQPSQIYNGQTLPLLSWNGPQDLVPKISVYDFSTESSYTDPAKCPGMDANVWQCAEARLSIEVFASRDECPWIILIYSSTIGGGSAAGSSWVSPAVRERIGECQPIPVNSYEVSWDPNAVQHDKELFLRSEDAKNNLLEQTLHTYLMESGTLCDGSKFDARAANCRLVAGSITMTPLGCDKSAVTATTIAHPIDSQTLHDIHITADISSVGAGEFSSTCSFRYLLDEL